MDRLIKKKNVSKLKLWKNLKRNGNERKKRKQIIEKIINTHVDCDGNKSVFECSVAVDSIENNVELDDALIFSTSQTHSVDNSCCETDVINFDTCKLPETVDNAEENSLKDSIRADLNLWSAKFSIHHDALNGLLDILNKNFPNINLPKDARTIMSTPRQVNNLMYDDHGGSYWHYGIKKALINCLSGMNFGASLSININIDGLPLYKSSRVEFWPILINVHELPNLMPMFVGIYCGKG